jgi:hypothetical protein
MKLRTLVAAALTVLVGAPLAAQTPAKGMTFTSRMELAKATGADAGASTDMGEMMANMFKGMMFPNGPVEMEYVTDGESVRTELRGQMAMLKKGSIILYQAGKTDGVVLDPAEKTYWVMKTTTPPEAAAVLAQMKPEVTVVPTGVFETILGHKAEKVNVTFRMAIPIPAGAEVPPNMPTELVMNMENWCASDVKMPSSVMKLAGMAVQGMPGFSMEDMVKACPFSLRMRMRMSMMPGWEMLTAVTKQGEASPTADLFKIPEGYKEVPMPKIGG